MVTELGNGWQRWKLSLGLVCREGIGWPLHCSSQASGFLGTWIVLLPLASELDVLSLPVFVLFLIGSYYVTQAGMELTVCLTSVDPLTAGIPGVHQHILPGDCHSFSVLGSEARFTSGAFSTASWVTLSFCTPSSNVSLITCWEQVMYQCIREVDPTLKEQAF